MIQVLGRHQRGLHTVVAIGILLLFGSCAWLSGDKERAEFLEPPSMEHTFGEATSFGAARAQWPHDRWWEQFSSLELDALMDTALKANPGLKVAAARLREAQGVVKVEGARLLPFLDADASLTYERLSQHGVFAALNKEVAGARFLLGVINPLSFRYEFDFWGKNRAMMEAALGQAAAEEAETAEVRLRLTTGVARAYVRGLALRQQYDVVQQILRIRLDLLRLAQTRSRLGLDDDLPVTQAVADLEAVRKREAGVRDQLDVQRNLLARLIGKGPDSARELFATRTITMRHEIPLPEHLSIGLLAHRPDLAAALYRTEASARLIKVAKAQFLPSIDLTAFVGFNALVLTKGASQLGNMLFSGQSFSYGIAPGLRLPWFEGGRLRGELAAQRGRYDAAVELYNETLLDAMREVADSLSAWQATSTMLDSHHRLLASLRDDWGLAKVRLASGLDDDREVLRHRQPVLEQEYALRALESDKLVAMVDLMEALGGGYHNPDLPQQQKKQSKPQNTMTSTASLSPTAKETSP
ncbi:MAG: efflux transporter outer membrane subunit [Nitrospirota bacterium]|nr:efflux transporter outer membrane subunit [Nitrospirota bacterium]